MKCFPKSVAKFKFSLKSDKNSGTLHGDQYAFLITSRSFVLGIRNVPDKSCGENKNSHFMLKTFFFFENHADYEIMWKNIVKPARPQLT